MDVRAEFLKFFEQKGHMLTPSAPLVADDATLLFVNAGMVPFKTIFTGEVPKPTPPLATSCQTCLRAGGKHNDLDNVGYTARHHTFFEMLGNFSFGEYFKDKAIEYAWEFITEVLKFPKERLWVTVHDSDDEAELLWQKYVPLNRIKRLGDKDNFWQMGDTGPCGPCSEIFYDQGSEHFSTDEDYLGGDGDRFLEIWNLVFMQYDRDKSGTLTPLPKPSIDTGMGLERVVAICEGVHSNYDTTLFMPIINEVAKICKSKYEYESGASYRVIADHIRSVSFLLAQGVNFDKEGRGYVLRRILRRAVRHGYLLGIKEPFMYKLLDTLCSLMGEQYPYLLDKKEIIAEQIKLEEKRFLSTIALGLDLFEKELKNTTDMFSGEVAFKLYDTYGFPLDLTADMLKDKKLEVDINTFDTLMQNQRDRAKASWKGSGDISSHGDFKPLLEKFGQNEFIGYETTKSKSIVLALMDDNFKEVKSLQKSGWMMLDKTPFYAQSGGQCGDGGEIKDYGNVIHTRKFFDLNLSHVRLDKPLNVGDSVEVFVNSDRLEIEKHHSATHLLHSALKKILGEHVSQAGSLVERDRLRFDFSHAKAMSSEEIALVEDAVNEMIFGEGDVKVDIMNTEIAKKSGAMALFGEKYGDEVRVISLGKDSVELCGGTHVKNLTSIGNFFITKESGVSSGVRRIEAVCGKSAYELTLNLRQMIRRAELEVKNRDIFAGIARQKKEIQRLKKEVESFSSSKKSTTDSRTIKGVEVIIDELDSGDIKARIDELKNQKDSIAIILFQTKDDKVLIASGVKNAPIKAGAWIKEIAPIIGGGGGGRDDFAQAGGKRPDMVEAAKKAALLYVEKTL